MFFILKGDYIIWIFLGKPLSRHATKQLIKKTGFR